MTRLMTNRSFLRTFHLATAAVLGCYIYWPEFREHPAGAIATQAVVMPLVTISGLWLWKGQTLLQAIRRGRRRAALETADLTA